MSLKIIARRAAQFSTYDYINPCSGHFSFSFIFSMLDLFRFISFVLNLHSVTIVNTAKIFPETNQYENEPIEMSVRNKQARSVSKSTLKLSKYNTTGARLPSHDLTKVFCTFMPQNCVRHVTCHQHWLCFGL